MIKPDISFLVPLYGFRVSFFFGKDRRREMFKYIASQLKEELPDGWDESEEASSGTTYAGGVWVKDKDDTPVLVHELYHLVQNVRRSLGKLGEETEAHLMGYLYEKVLTKLKTDKEGTCRS